MNNSGKGISNFAKFIFDKRYEIGEVHAHKYEDDESQVYNLLNPGLHQDRILNDNEFINLQKLLPPLEQPAMQTKKQWDLYEKVRPYVPSEYQDIICPQPTIDKKEG